MNHLNTETVDKALRVSGPLLACLGAVYLLGMFVYPFYKGGWAYAHDVWYDWQSLNVGVLAFAASVIAFYVSRYQENRKREREFVAARALLPQTLSDLTGYCRACVALLREAQHNIGSDEAKPMPLENAMPGLPENLNDTFSRCIASADRDVGAYLADILMKLQINHSRLKELHVTFGRSWEHGWSAHSVMTHFCDVGELQALVNKLFPFARAMEPFDGTRPNWEDFCAAYGMLDVDLVDVPHLADFTKRRISSQGRNADIE